MVPFIFWLTKIYNWPDVCAPCSRVLIEFLNGISPGDDQDIFWDESEPPNSTAEIDHATFYTILGTKPETFQLEYNANGSAVPEPSSLLLMAAGLAGLAAVVRRGMRP